MEIETKYQIEQAASIDETRLSMQNLYFEKQAQDGVIVATDGRILAVIPIKASEVEKSGYVNKQALIDGRKVIPKAFGSIEVKIGKETTLVHNSAQYPIDQDLRFPNWQQVIPKKGDIQITFNPVLFAKLVKAMGIKKGESITLGISKKGNGMGPIRVDTENGAFGALMPMMARR